MSLYKDFNVAAKGLSDVKKVELSRLFNKAQGYAWGANDFRSEDVPRVDAEAFTFVYGIHTANFLSDKINWHMPIQDAFESFTKYGEIRRYGDY